MFVTVLQLVFLLTAMGGGFAARTSSGALDEAVRTRVSKSYWRLPLRFEANQGQTDNRVKFLSRGLGYNLFLTSGEAVFSLRSNKTFRVKENSKRDSKTQKRKAATVFSIQLMGVNPSIKSAGLEKLPIKTNYLIGNDPRAWRQDIPTYAKVEFKELYAGIDLVYYGNQRQLEFDFLVHPGADHKSIRMKFKNVQHLSTDSKGNLVVSVAGGKILLEKPLIYQRVDGKKRTVSGHYKLQTKNIVGFQVATYDSKIPLVIDPVLNYSTYLGGDFNDLGNGVAVDVFGNAYVTGATQSTDFPTTAGAWDEILTSFRDAFVTKFKSDGTALVYSTYLGGDGDDFGSDVAVDSSGNAYIVGTTQSTSFPTTTGAFQENPNGVQSAFVTKLNSTGTAPLVYSTYLGGALDDSGNGIAVDSSGNAYIVGTTQSATFPTTTFAFQENLSALSDAFFSKLITDGSALVYSTYLGGNKDDIGNGIAVDSSGNAYIVGTTQSTTFHTTTFAFQPHLNGVQDAFVTKFDPSQFGDNSLIYSTYLGGALDDSGNGIVVDSPGNAYIVGITKSGSFPITTGAFQEALNGVQDAFVTKLNSAGTAPLVYSTYLGGNSDDFGNGIAVDSSGNSYIVGATRSIDFPTQDPLQSSLIGLQDAFVTELNADGSALIYSTYLGGADNDSGNSIAVDTSGNAYITGTTGSNDFPTEDAFQPNLSGLEDAFVAKINPSGEAILYSTYIGDSADDLGGSIAVDSAGNAYIVGTTASVDFPITTGVFEEIQQGAQDAFVSKLDPFGDTFLYSTYLGGSGDDIGRGIAVDSAGNAYVVGTTESTDFPNQNALPGGNAGQKDAFVTKLDADGSALDYSTYLGGTQDDEGNGIAVDSAGNAYVVGTTESTDFPNQNALPGGYAWQKDAFVAKFDPLLSGVASLIYSTYLGGANDDLGNSIAVDTSNNAYVAGTTLSNDFPTKNAFQAANAGSDDAFVTKFDPSLSGVASLIYSTYLGGSMDDLGNGIAVDTSNKAYVAGTTLSDDFPVKNPLQPTRGGDNDAFISKFNSAGSALTYSTYLGGSMDDLGNSIAVDISGNAYVTGTTVSDNFPTENAFQANRHGGKDGFITKVDNAGSTLVYSSYLGGTDEDLGNDIAVDGLGNAFVTGSTKSFNFPTKSVQDIPGGGSDAFVTKVQEREDSDIRRGGSTGGGGGGVICFIATAAYGSPMSRQFKLLSVIFILFVLLCTTLIVLFRRLKLREVVFETARPKSK